MSDQIDEALWLMPLHASQRSATCDARAHVNDSQSRDDVHAALMAKITDLRLAPGSLVNEKPLMNELGCSRAALQQAIHRLVENGLVVVVPRRGMVIRPMDVLDVQQIAEARMTIEVAVARLAAKRATSTDIAELRAMLEQVDQLRAERPGDFSAFIRLDVAIHTRIARASGNHFLHASLVSILPLNARLWHRFFLERGTDEEFFFPHWDELNAIAEGDERMAEKAAMDHIMNSRDALAEVFWPDMRSGSPAGADLHGP